MNAETSIFVGRIDKTAWVRIEGVATKDTSIGIKQYFSDKFSEGFRNFIVDLGACRMIDSTFIGILTGLAGNIAEEESGGDVKVIHTNERNEKSICKLGLDSMITIKRGGIDSEEVENQIKERLDLLDFDDDIDTVEKTAVILEAHEDICSANEENVDEFCDVLSLLRKELDQSN